jgi:hypothetical protein
LAIQNKRPSLKLRKRIEDMVDRAAKLYWQKPRATEIEKQAEEGDAKAKACLADLEKCIRGQAEIMSIEWNKHGEILEPSRAEGESCREKAAQICIDWLRWIGEVYTPASDLSPWLDAIGRPDLAKRFDIYPSLRERLRQGGRKMRNADRQRRQRLKKRERKLVQEARRRQSLSGKPPRSS